MAVADSMIPAVTAAPEASVREVARLLRSRGADCVVLADDGRPVGLVSARDLALALAEDLDPEGLARRLASSPVIAVEADAEPARALARMDAYGVRRLVVVRGGRVAGVLPRARLAPEGAIAGGAHPVAGSI